MKFVKKHIWLILILLVNLGIVIYPTLATSMPITQTDGLTYFSASKLLADTGDFFAEFPDYMPVKGDEATHVNEFLPVPILYMAAFIKIFGERIVMNSGALGLLFVLANLYLYLFVEKLTGRKKVALVTTLFSALNFRFYFLLWGGNWSNVFAMMLGMPTLYYFLKYLRDSKAKDIVLSIVFLLLTAGSHTMHFLFVATLMAALFVGEKLLKNTKAKWPEIKFSMGSPDSKSLSTAVTLIVGAVVSFFVTFVPFVLAGTRTYWVDEWIGYLKSFDKVPQIWHYGVLADGPILIVLGFVGLLYFIYKNKWGMAALMAMSYLIANMTSYLVPDQIWLSLFIYRYAAVHFILLALATCYLAFEIMKSHPKLKKTITTLIVLSLIWQAVKMGGMMSQIEPAITEDELAAAEYMFEIGEDFWLVNNVDTFSSFRSHEWILFYADGDKDNTSTTLEGILGDYDYIMVQDVDGLAVEGEVVFEQGVVAIYKTS